MGIELYSLILTTTRIFEYVNIMHVLHHVNIHPLKCVPNVTNVFFRKNIQLLLSILCMCLCFTMFNLQFELF
jgi:predicted permease